MAKYFFYKTKHGRVQICICTANKVQIINSELTHHSCPLITISSIFLMFPQDKRYTTRLRLNSSLI